MERIQQILNRYGFTIKKGYEQKVIEMLAMPKLQIEGKEGPLDLEIQKKILTAFSVANPCIKIANKEIFDRVFNTKEMTNRFPNCMWEMLWIIPYKSGGDVQYFFGEESPIQTRVYVQNRLSNPDPDLTRFVKEHRLRTSFLKNQEPSSTLTFILDLFRLGAGELSESPVLITFTAKMVECLIEKFQDHCVFAKQL